jgi:hypothetical protein
LLYAPTWSSSSGFCCSHISALKCVSYAPFVSSFLKQNDYSGPTSFIYIIFVC